MVRPTSRASYRRRSQVRSLRSLQTKVHSLRSFQGPLAALAPGVHSLRSFQSLTCVRSPSQARENDLAGSDEHMPSQARGVSPLSISLSLSNTLTLTPLLLT